MSYKIGFDGMVTAELEKLLHSVENRVNGMSMHALATTEMGASTVASGSPCPEGQTCSDTAKGGHDLGVVAAAIVAGALAGAAAGFVAGRVGAATAKGGHDGAKGGHN